MPRGPTPFTSQPADGAGNSSSTTRAVQVTTQPGGGGGGGGVVVPASGIDNDHDGFLAGRDCNDANAAIRPGAIEIKGNNFDENCDGLAEPFPTLTSGVVSKWDVKSTRFTLTTLQVTQQFPKGWKAKIFCKGKSCPFKSKTLKAGKVKKGAATIISSLSKKQRRFRAGQTRRGLGQRAELQHEGRAARAQEGQDPDDASRSACCRARPRCRRPVAEAFLRAAATPNRRPPPRGCCYLRGRQWSPLWSVSFWGWCWSLPPR